MFKGSYSAINFYTETETDVKLKDERLFVSKKIKEISDLKEKLKLLNSESYY